MESLSSTNREEDALFVRYSNLCFCSDLIRKSFSILYIMQNIFNINHISKAIKLSLFYKDNNNTTILIYFFIISFQVNIYILKTN